MKFDFNDYRGKYVMCCKTDEEANKFCELMGNEGKIPLSDSRHPRNTCWNVYQEHTCYDFNTGGYGHKLTYEDQGYIILYWKDFMGKEKEFTLDNLKSGMLIKIADERLLLLISTRIGMSGFTKDLNYVVAVTKECYDINLRVTYENSNEYNIVEVYDIAYETEGDLFNTHNRKLLWKRQECIKMTIEEIKIGLNLSEYQTLEIVDTKD